MTLKPRAALCAAFTLASSLGAVFVAQCAAAPRPAEPAIETTFEPSPETEYRVHRVAFRQETIADLMNEEITLQAAAERFWDLSTGTTESLISLRSTIPGTSDEQRVIAQVLLFAQVHASKEPVRYAARLAKLQAEAGSFQLKPAVVH